MSLSCLPSASCGRLSDNLEGEGQRMLCDLGQRYAGLGSEREDSKRKCESGKNMMLWGNMVSLCRTWDWKSR